MTQCMRFAYSNEMFPKRVPLPFKIVLESYSVRSGPAWLLESS
jgi:hypothetical protein